MAISQGELGLSLLYAARPLARCGGKSLSALKKGQGKILLLQGKKVAAYRDDAGKVTLCSPVCTHLGCIVHWKAADRTWDCPCHGSRFHPDGEVFGGPAEKPLERVHSAVTHAGDERRQPELAH